ncbi:hypothetical protein C5B85_15815 [Pseudoclavibacter sp. AY1F1]|uniref:DUF6807 family protein n=1 Tax=Pseudoclavibacter sp. AY1F1 TaxID=2080583 RepID=UPI000CE8B8A9|nr:DUF6807 family protein [Pseudoclavibacter sp. AY1F1]PPF42734.1 hypothetical protein C5B85_15815 [Pseudoclavibacter sp. AY1F1]
MSAAPTEELPSGLGTVVFSDPTALPLESPRPYVHPVRTPGGAVVSDYRPADHDWHWGLSVTVANIRIGDAAQDTNLWGGVTWVPDRGYAQLDNNGSQTVDGTHLTWREADGSAFLREKRMLDASIVDVHGSPVGIIDVLSSWTNLRDVGLAFGSPTTAGRPNAGYGGLFLRLHRSFDGARLLSPLLQTDPDAVVHGAEAPWLGLDAGRATVVMGAHPENPVSPAPWFVRNDATPMLCAAPFFHEEWMLGAGESATWRWRILLSDSPINRDDIWRLLGTD